MEPKTNVTAEAGKQEIHITRTFDLPLELLFQAYEDPEIVAEWMGTQVQKLESRKHGSYRFETVDPKGNTHGFSGVIHDFVPNRKITRTFEMESASVGVQLELLEFEALTPDTSRLTMHVLYESVAQRDQVIAYGMTRGIDLAHNRIQKIMNNRKLTSYDKA